MKDFVLLTDSGCDLSMDILNDLNVNCIGLSYSIKGNTYTESSNNSLDIKEFYNILKNETEMPTTSQVNSFRFKEFFEPYVKKDIAIIYISFSSALSGTYNSSILAKEEILEEYPNADINIIDSKCASTGQGLLVYNASIMKSEGKSKDDIVTWLEDNKLNVCHFFTVDNLDHLKRGGRISPTAAAIGGLLSIKPVLYVNNNGELKNFAKVKGRKKAIKTLFEKFENHVVNPEDQVIFISHGDCLEEAKQLATMLKEKYNFKDIIINYVGPTIGCHTGQGVLTYFFLGNKREP